MGILDNDQLTKVAYNNNNNDNDDENDDVKSVSEFLNLDLWSPKVLDDVNCEKKDLQ